MSNPEKIIELASKNQNYLKTLQKALVFDEDDPDSFENTYHEMLSEMIETNLQIKKIAFKIIQVEIEQYLNTVK